MPIDIHNSIDISTVYWPKMCVRCGCPIEDLSFSCKTAISGGLLSAFDRSSPTHVYLPACKSCRRSVWFGASLASLGMFLAFFAIAGSVFIVSVFSHQSTESVTGAGGFFWLGVIFLFIGDRISRTVKIKHRSKNQWTIEFFRQDLYDQFMSCNQNHEGLPTRFEDQKSEHLDNATSDLYVKGSMFEYKGRWDEAIGVYEQIVQMGDHPQYKAAQEAIARLQEKMKRASL